MNKYVLQLFFLLVIPLFAINADVDIDEGLPTSTTKLPFRFPMFWKRR